VDLFISYGAKGTRRELRLLRTNRLGPATDEVPPEVDATDITVEEEGIQQVRMFDHPRGQDCSSRDDGEMPGKLKCDSAGIPSSLDRQSDLT
jgi:hypothetical protein